MYVVTYESKRCHLHLTENNALLKEKNRHNGKIIFLSQQTVNNPIHLKTCKNCEVFQNYKISLKILLTGPSLYFQTLKNLKEDGIYSIL